MSGNSIPQNESLRLWRYVLAQTGNNPAVALRLIQRLFDELPHQLGAIGVALAHADWEASGRIVHIVHGSSAYFDLSAVKASAHALELRLRAGRTEGWQGLLAKLEAEVNSVLAQRQAVFDYAALAVEAWNAGKTD